MIFQAIKEANLPKFVDNDINIFLSILSDLFPELEHVTQPDERLYDNVVTILRNKKYLTLEPLIKKIFQLWDIIKTRHGLMLVGGSMSGKSTCYNVLAEALTSLSMTSADHKSVHLTSINPKAITVNEIYGYSDPISKEWTEGILAHTFKTVSKNYHRREWIVFDGPVDADWIENMNTVLDDNKVLCLMNSDKIPMNNSMTMMFETDDLSKASPATVSRCGMVYLPENTIGAKNFYLRWLDANYSEMYNQ